MVVTEQILKQGKSSRGGWSRRQFQALGLETKKDGFPITGWKQRVIGADIPNEKVYSFLALKDRHLKNHAPLFNRPLEFHHELLVKKIQAERTEQRRLEEETNSI